MTNVSDIEGFEARQVKTPCGAVHVSIGGTGAPLLLLHGFPETGLMWHAIAPLLARHFEVVVADLPGYGASDCPRDEPHHRQMSKRQLAETLRQVMKELGHHRFAVVGHDRGGRVAYRAALDHPAAISAVAVLDVIPTLEVWERADSRLALSFWPFSLLAQPFPLPERLLLGAPEAAIDDALSQWGSPANVFLAEHRQAYVAALCHPDHVHAICEEYRAAAGIDRDHDRADREARQLISAPLLALWAATGGLTDWYREDGGPLGIWRRWAEKVSGQAIEGGHFFPEERPDEIAELLTAFLLEVSETPPAAAR